MMARQSHYRCIIDFAIYFDASENHLLNNIHVDASRHDFRKAGSLRDCAAKLTSICTTQDEPGT